MAVHSYGTTLELDEDNNGSYVAVANVTAINGPTQAVSVVNATHLLSPSARMERIPGLIDPGEFTFTILFAASGYARILNSLRQVGGFRVTYPDGTGGTTTNGSRIQGTGFVSNLGGITAEEDSVLSCECTLTNTGALTFTSATP